MARVGIVFGLVLCGITFAGLVVIATKTPTQFYPMMLGIPILFLGVVALNPHRRRFAILISSAIAAVGAMLGTMWSAVQMLSLGPDSTDLQRDALRLIGAMVVVCVIFVVWSALWFRRVKEKAAAVTKRTEGTVRLPSSLDSTAEDSEISTSSREIA